MQPYEELLLVCGVMAASGVIISDVPEIQMDPMVENISATIAFRYPTRNKINIACVIGKGYTVLINLLDYPCTMTGQVEELSLNNVTCNDTVASVLVQNVKPDMHGNLWTCGYGTSQQTVTVKVFVIVPVTGVDIDNGSQKTITAREKVNITLICRSSYSRPNVSISLHMVEDSESLFPVEENETKYFPNTQSTLWQTETKFIFLAKRSLNQKHVYCFATNHFKKNVTSSNITMNIQYSPSYLKVAGLPNIITIYRVIEHTEKRLTCHIDDSNPPANLTWICYNTDTSQTSGNRTHQALFFRASRNRNAKCACTSVYNKTENMTTIVHFDVLYKPDVIVANLSTNRSLHSNINTTFSIIENENVSLMCSANGNPPPDRYHWSGLQSNSSSQVYLSPSRKHNGNVTCQATNTMTDTEGNNQAGSYSQTFTISVLYPPELAVQRLNYTVAEGDNVTVICNAVGGSASSQSVSWNTSFDSTTNNSSSALTILNALRCHTGNYICKVHFNLIPTYGTLKEDQEETVISIDVLYRPEEIVAILTVNDAKVGFISESFSVIENTTLTMICSAGGKPNPSRYSWSGLHAIDDDTLTFFASRHSNGILTCNAFNTLELTNGSNIIGSGHRSYALDVLYPPKAIDFQQENVSEGAYITIDCLSDLGKTSKLLVCWETEHITVTCSRQLYIKNVTAINAGLYTCAIKFIMEPTYGEIISRSALTGIFLNVIAKEAHLHEHVSERTNDTSMSLAVGGTVGGLVLVTAAAAASVFLIRKRRLTNTSREETAEYQNIGCKNVINSTSITENFSVYESLKNAAFTDHHYQEMSTFKRRQHEDNQGAYENLKVTQSILGSDPDVQ